MTAAAWTEWVPCNLCGSQDLAVLFTAARSGRQVVRCRRCRLVFYDPQPSPAQAEALYCDGYFAEEFPAATAAERGRLYHRRLERIEREAGIGRLLDVGCGTGGFLVAARERGWRVAGLDASPAAVRAAAAACGAGVLEGSLDRDRPAGLEAFDVVTMWDVLEHLSDPAGALARVPAWLAAGGLLVLQTQNVDSVTSAWMRRRWEQFVEPHLYHFSPATLRRALARAGARAVRVEGVDEFLGVRGPRGHGVAGGLRRLRDLALVAAGWDRFNVMVATARWTG